MKDKLEGIEAAKRLAEQIQPLGHALEDLLKSMAGERVSFVLVMTIGQVTSYCANVEREDGMHLLQEVLDRWKAGRADIPAYMNPDLHPGALKRNYRFPDGRMDWGAVDDELHAIMATLPRNGHVMPKVQEAISELHALLRKVSGQ